MRSVAEAVCLLPALSNGDCVHDQDVPLFKDTGGRISVAGCFLGDG